MTRLVVTDSSTRVAGCSLLLFWLAPSPKKTGEPHVCFSFLCGWSYGAQGRWRRRQPHRTSRRVCSRAKRVAERGRGSRRDEGEQLLSAKAESSSVWPTLRSSYVHSACTFARVPAPSVDGRGLLFSTCVTV
eukprot:5019335-Pleurochrysis_carterae.AAC.1